MPSDFRPHSPRTALSPQAQMLDRHFRMLSIQRRIYGVAGTVGLVVLIIAIFVYSNSVNAGKFPDRLPYLFDFASYLKPRDSMEIVRALFDLNSPFFAGSQQFAYTSERVMLWDGFYIPNYVYRTLVTINIAGFSTLLGFLIAFPLCFFAAQNTMPSAAVRFAFRRIMEFFRAFPILVIAGFLSAIIASGPVPAMIAITVHTIGALGKLFFEVIENADMKADEGLAAVGGNWATRMRFGYVPDVLVNFLSYALLRMEINVRESTIIGAVGGGGIGESLYISIGRGDGAKTIAIIILLFVTVIAVDSLSGWLRRRLVGREAFAAN